MRLPFFKSGATGTKVPLPEMAHALFVVYVRLEGDVPDLLPVVDRWLAEHAPAPLGEAVRGFAERFLTPEVQVRDALPEPPIEYLRLFRLGELEERRLEEATHAIVIATPDILGHPRVGYWTALGAARALAQELGGVIMDADIPRVLPLDSHTQDLPGDAVLRPPDHIVIPHSVDERTGLGWITTKGLGRFGLPELQIRNVPTNLFTPLGSVVNGMCRRLLLETARCVEGSPSPPRELVLDAEFRLTLEDVLLAYGPQGDPIEAPPGARGWSLLGLRFERGRRGEDSFLTLLPPPGFRGTHAEWLNSLLEDLFAPEDQVANVRADSEAMEAAHLQAVSELPRVRERFRAGLGPGEQLFVKHGFPYGEDQPEYMWVVVARWQGDRLHGHLANDPVYCLNLRAGQEVTLREAEVYDWLLMGADGNQEGGYTQRALEQEAERP